MRLVSLGIALMLTTCSVAPCLAQNLIVNGSFETPALDPGHLLPPQNLITPAIPGWVDSSGFGVEIGTADAYGVSGQDADQVLELDSNGNSIVTQTLTLTPGTYQLSFLYALRSNESTASNLFDVAWNGTVVRSIAPVSQVMTEDTLFVTALRGANTLTFIGTGIQDTGGGIVDNVQLVSTAAAPEPDSLALLGMAALPIAGVVRLRKSA